MNFIDFSSEGENWNLLPTRIPDGLNNFIQHYISSNKNISQEIDMAIARLLWIVIHSSSLVVIMVVDT